MPTHAVGIDLGTTYSCIAALDEHGKPTAIPNPEGEHSTPSVVLFEEGGGTVVGEEALRHAIVQPRRVVQHAKRFMGEPDFRWTIDGKKYSPVDVSAIILRHLLGFASQHLGSKIERAVITVPAAFSEQQRRATETAGRMAGLTDVGIINEPVAAALCHVLSEGDWYTELADEQIILVFDLGGGTFDLSLVKYHRNEVRVLAGAGDLHLGGIDWNQALLNFIADKFEAEFGENPRNDPESLQFLFREVEQAKRSLSIRTKTPLTVQHMGKRKTYQIDQDVFARLTEGLVRKTEEITRKLLRDQKLGWAKINVVLKTGGSSRMPMIRDMLKQLSGRTLNEDLNPDLSIAYGAALYGGMLLSNLADPGKAALSETTRSRLSKIKQYSVNARALGILVRDPQAESRVPHYLIPPNTALPTSIDEEFGTVVPDQRQVHLRIIESGETPEAPWVEVGECRIDGLPPNLPAQSRIKVTIHYDASARVRVSARDLTSGKEASAEIVRPQSVTQRSDDASQGAVQLMPPPGRGLRTPDLSDGLVLRDDTSGLKPTISGRATFVPVEQARSTGSGTGPAVVSAARPVPQPVDEAAPRLKPVPVAEPPRAVPKPAVEPPASKPTPAVAGDARTPPQPVARPQVRPLPAASAGSPSASRPAERASPPAPPSPRVMPLETSEIPIPLCDECGSPLNPRGVCTNRQCVASIDPGQSGSLSRPKAAPPPPVPARPKAPPPPAPRGPAPKPKPPADDVFLPPLDDIFELPDLPPKPSPKPPPLGKPAASPRPAPRPTPPARKLPPRREP